MKDGNAANSFDPPAKKGKDEALLFTTSLPQITVISNENPIEQQIDSAVRTIVPLSQKINNLIDSTASTTIMTIATLYALFGDDIKSLSFEKSADNVFSSLVIVCLFLFFLELSLSFCFKANYKWSFYFWLDLIAMISLITDIGWMWDAALGLESDGSGDSLKSAGNASKAGAKTARVLRIIRLVRLVRIVKLYKNVTIAIKNFKKHEELDEFTREIAQTNESNVGKQMSELTMKRVIFFILLMLFILPLFDVNFYFSYQSSWDFGLEELQTFLNQVKFEEIKEKYINYHSDDYRPIVYLKFSNDTGTYSWTGETPYWDLRYNEIYYSDTKNLVSIFDLRYDSRLTSLLSICRTIYICIVLTIGSIYFSKDSEELVISPIEKMMTKVKMIAKNPISAGEIQEASAKLDEKNQKIKKSKFCCNKTVEQESFETKLLENTIIKIGVLLALGFGEAGSLIIGSNVEQGGEVDPMMSGSKVVGIYGFCDIRNFTDTTEELQEGVMMFVNEIAQVVHGIVDKYLGAANKNIGDAFLLVWKFSSDEFFLDGDNTIMRNPDNLRAAYLPDLSLMSFLKILAKVNKDPVMLKYRTNQKLLQRMPNYEVKMGFGLHLGWAIEGAIGSQFKIDASYLSPNVNVASALEGSTKIYGVPLLISSELYQVFSQPVQKYCRHIDSVFIKGNAKPIGLYTSDCDFLEFLPGKNVDRSKKYFRRKRKQLTKALDRRDFTTGEMFARSKEMSLMRKVFTEEFFIQFDEGVKSYVTGHWMQAKFYLEKAMGLRMRDGPSLALLNYMSDYNFQAPDDWKCARILG